MSAQDTTLLPLPDFSAYEKAFAAELEFHCLAYARAAIAAQAQQAQGVPAEFLPVAVSSAPHHIWLDLGFDPYEEDAHFSNLHKPTWSEDNAIGNGIKYVRADLLAAAPQAEPAQAQVVPAGMALVPLRMTQAMNDVTETEDWQWADLLAAAEAITEEEYNLLAAAPQAEPQPEREPLTPGDVHRIAKTTGAEHSVCNGYWPHRFALAVQSELADRWGIKLAGIGTKKENT